MKAHSLTKIITFVSIIFVGCVGFAADPAANPFAPTYSAEQSCDSALAKVADTWSKAVSTCKTSGNGGNIKECSSTLKECADSYEEELPMYEGADLASINPALSQLFQVEGGTSPNCSDYTRSEYKSEERDIKKDLESTKKTLQEAQRQTAKDLEDFNKDKATLDQQIQEAKEQKVAQDLEYKKAQMEKSRDREKEAMETANAIQSLETEILNTQNSIEVGTRAREIKIIGYNQDLLKCKISAEEFGLKRAQAQAAKKSSGSINSASSRASSLSREMKNFFDDCAKTVYATRAAEAEAFEAQKKLTFQKLEQLVKKLDVQRKNQAAAAQRNQQEDEDEKLAKAQKDYSDSEKYQNLLIQKQEAQKVYFTKYNQNQAEIIEAEKSKNLASNELKNFQTNKKPRGKTSSTDADTSVSEYVSAKALCSNACAAFAKKRGCTPDEPAGSGNSVRPASGANGADGTPSGN